MKGSTLEELYQEILMRHVNAPKNQAAMDAASADAEVYNPLCGDRVRMRVDLGGDGGQVRFDGEGCAICMASASIAATKLSGLNGADADELAARMLRILSGEESLAEDDGEELGAVAGVQRFPMRLKCAKLPWQAAVEALARKQGELKS